MAKILVRYRPEGLSKIPLVAPNSFQDVTDEVGRKAYERNPTARSWNWSVERTLNIPVGARVYRDKRGKEFVGFPPEVYLKYAEEYPEFGLMDVKEAKKRVFETGGVAQRASFAGQPSSLVSVSDELTRSQAERIGGVLEARKEEARKFRRLLESQSNVTRGVSSPGRVVGVVNPFDWAFKSRVTPKKILGGSQISVRLPFGARLANALRAQKKR